MLSVFKSGRIAKKHFFCAPDGKGLPVNDDRENKWPARIFFTTTGLFFFGCVWYLFVGAMNPEYYWQASPTLSDARPNPVLAKNGRLLLLKNQAARVDDVRLVYRGTREGDLVLELFVLALDPHYGYSHRIDEDMARQGFSIGEYHFQVLAASDAKISLKRL